MENSILISIVSIFISVISLIISFLIGARQNRISLKQYTLSYIDMENNDELLIKSREWLLNIENKIEYINSFYSSRSFLEYNGVCVHGLEEGQFPADKPELVNEFIYGTNCINKIIGVRTIASEAIISRMIDEETYWLARHVDFFLDYRKLEGYILRLYNQKGCDERYSRKTFRMIVKRWRDEEIIDVKSEIKKIKWRKYDESFRR